MENNLIDTVTKKVFERIDTIRKEKGFTDKQLCDQLSVLGVKTNRNTVNDWRKGKSTSFLNCVGEIATIFEMSVDDLTKIEPFNQIGELNDMEEVLIKSFRSLPMQQKLDVVFYTQELEREKTNTSQKPSIG